MPATAADRELVLRYYGEAKTATAVTGFKPMTSDAPATSRGIKQVQLGGGAPQPLMGVSKTAADAQNAKSKKKEQPTPPGVVRLELDADTPAKRAPEKKPEEKSENVAQKAAAAVQADKKPAPVSDKKSAPAPDKKPAQEAASQGDIPVLGRTGGAVLGGLGRLAGGLGWRGGQEQLQEWGGSPTGRNIAGGATALLAAVATALAARQAFRGKQEEGLELEAAAKLDLVKRSLLGRGVRPLEPTDERIPRRTGVIGTSRSDIYSKLDNWSRGK